MQVKKFTLAKNIIDMFPRIGDFRKTDPKPIMNACLYKDEKDTGRNFNVIGSKKEGK
jgi:hypothetical protein